ncbi:hypothetical protein GCM10027276_36020 [Comamonas piscis]
MLAAVVFSTWLGSLSAPFVNGTAALLQVKVGMLSGLSGRKTIWAWLLNGTARARPISQAEEEIQIRGGKDMVKTCDALERSPQDGCISGPKKWRLGQTVPT